MITSDRKQLALALATSVERNMDNQLQALFTSLSLLTAVVQSYSAFNNDANCFNV